MAWLRAATQHKQKSCQYGYPLVIGIIIRHTSYIRCVYHPEMHKFPTNSLHSCMKSHASTLCRRNEPYSFSLVSAGGSFSSFWFWTASIAADLNTLDRKAVLPVPVTSNDVLLSRLSPGTNEGVTKLIEDCLRLAPIAEPRTLRLPPTP